MPQPPGYQGGPNNSQPGFAPGATMPTPPPTPPTSSARQTGKTKGQYNRGQTGGIRKQIAAGAQWGYGNMQDQGFSGGKEDGASAAARFKNKEKWGAFDSPTWDKMVDPKTGLVMWRAKSHQTDRVKEGQGEWFVAPDYIQRSYQRQQAWNAANPGGTYFDRLQQMGFNKHKASGLIQYDPATGLYVNSAGETWDNTGRKVEDNNPYLSGAAKNPWNPAYAGPKAGGTGARFAGAQWNNKGGWQAAQPQAGTGGGQQAGAAGTGGGMYSMGTEYNQFNQPWQTSPQGQRSVALGNYWGSTRQGSSGGAQGGWGTNSWANPTGSIANMKGMR